MKKQLNWKRAGDGQSMTAWASRVVGGKYHVSRREGSDGVGFEVEHLTLANPGCSSDRYRGCWNTRPVQQQPVARTDWDAIAAAEADNQRLINARDRERRLSAVERVAPE